MFSPDGKWLAYAGTESGRWEVYVQQALGPGERTVVSNQGGYEPIWAPDGGRIYYRTRSEMMVADVLQTTPRFRTGKPRMLFEDKYIQGAGAYHRCYDIHPDGKRFLMLQSPEQTSTPVREIRIVQNWFEELKRLVPTGK